MPDFDPVRQLDLQLAADQLIHALEGLERLVDAASEVSLDPDNLSALFGLLGDGAREVRKLAIG